MCMVSLAISFVCYTKNWKQVATLIEQFRTLISGINSDRKKREQLSFEPDKVKPLLTNTHML